MLKFQTLRQVAPSLCEKYKDAQFGDCVDRIFVNFEPTDAEFHYFVTAPVHRPVVNFDARIIYVGNYGKDLNLEHGYFFGDTGVMWEEENKEISLSDGTYEGFVSWKSLPDKKLSSPRPDMDEFFNFNIHNNMERANSFVAHKIFNEMKDIWYTKPIILLRPNTNLFEGLKKAGLMDV